MKALRMLPVILLLCLCVCLLAACGGKDKAAVGEESKEVYAATFIPVMQDEENYPEPLCLTGEGLYFTCYEKLADGEIPEGVTPEYEGQYDIYGNKLYYVNLEGEVRTLPYESLPAPETDPEKESAYSGVTLQRLYAQPDGSLLAVENVSTSWWDGPKGLSQDDPSYYDYYRYENSFWVRRLDAEGREISANPVVGEIGEDSYLDFFRSACDGEGRIWTTHEESLLCISAEGEILASVDLGGWTNGVAALPEGRIGVIVWGMKGAELALIDAEKQEIDRRLTLDNEPQRVFAGNGDFDFCYLSGMRLYGYRLAEESSTEILNWVDCDVVPDQIRMLRFLEDGRIAALAMNEGALDLVLLKQVPRESVAQKQVLTLGTLDPDMVSDAVSRFNRRSDGVKIEIVDYSRYRQGNSDEEVMEGLTKLTTEIIAGNAPDLLALQGLPYAQLAAKGLLEDLYPWIDADPELSRGDFFPSVLKASELGGKLYQVCPSFSLYSLIGASSVVGEESGWTFDDLEQALSAMPEGCVPLNPAMSRDNVLMMLLFTDLNSYVNWESASCDFENEDFYKLLGFCAQYSETPNFAGDGLSQQARVAAGKQLLMDVEIYDLDEVCYHDQYFGGSCTYVGYPTRSGSGNVLYLTEGYAMSASCSNKEAAWDFLRSFLGQDYQRGQYGLPLRLDVFEEKVEAAGIEYEKDAEGHYRLDENGERIPVSKGGMGMSDESGVMVQYELYGLTPEQGEKLRAVINSADRCVDMNTRIFSIVREEAAAYFAGQKSVEEVCRLIQSKVSLYLSEQS